MTSGGMLELNLHLLRHYLRVRELSGGEELLLEAFFGDEPGALYLVRLCLGVRGNPRTRQHIETVRQQWWLLRTTAGTAQATDWYRTITNTVYGLYALLRR